MTRVWAGNVRTSRPSACTACPCMVFRPGTLGLDSYRPADRSFLAPGERLAGQPSFALSPVPGQATLCAMSTPEPNTWQPPTAATWGTASFFAGSQALALWNTAGLLDGGKTFRNSAIVLAGYWTGVVCARALLGPFSRTGLLLASMGGMAALMFGMAALFWLGW